jgi:hypothetical protein
MPDLVGPGTSVNVVLVAGASKPLGDTEIPAIFFEDGRYLIDYPL